MRGLRITLERKRKIEREEEEEKEEDASRLNIDEPGRSSNSIRKHSSSANVRKIYVVVWSDSDQIGPLGLNNFEKC